MLQLTSRFAPFPSLLIVAALAFGGHAFAARTAPIQGDAKEKMQEGLDQLRRGEDEKALETFRAILGSNPSNEDAWRIWREVDQAVFLRMLAKGGEYESIARALLAKATPSLRESRKDAEAIQALVEEAIGADFAKRQHAMAKLTGEHGAYTIQGLVGPLSDAGNDERRIRAMEVAYRMGGMGVPPLVALLDSEDPTARRSAIVVLARLKDPRALAPVASVGESDPDSIVKAEARRAALSMGWSGLDGSSAEAWTAAATSYLRRHADFVRSTDANDVVWDLTSGKLVDSAIPPVLYGTEMARRAALRSLHARADNPRALGVLAMALAEIRTLAPGLTEEQQNALAEKRTAFDEALRLCGANALTTALSMALEVNDANLAIELLREIAATTTPGSPVPMGVVAALRARSREVRLQAAVTACQIDPNQGMNPEIAKFLADGVGEKVQRIALVIDEMPERRGAFTQGFEEARWFVAPCDTALSGLARVRRFAGVDLIVVSASLRDLVAEEVIDELRADERTKGIPIVVAVEANAVEGATTRFGDRVKAVVAKFDAAAMDALVADAPMNPERMRAEELAAASATAIGHTPVMNEVVREVTLAALAEAAVGRADAVRIPALKALARFAGVNQQQDLASVLTDATASPAAKVAACNALAAVGVRNGAFSAEAQKALAAAAHDADASVRIAAAGAMGRAPNLDAASREKALHARNVSLSSFAGSGDAHGTPASEHGSQN